MIRYVIDTFQQRQNKNQYYSMHPRHNGMSNNHKKTARKKTHNERKNEKKKKMSRTKETRKST